MTTIRQSALRRVTAALIAAPLASAAIGSAIATTPIENDAASAQAAYENAVNAGDLDTIVSLFAEDGGYAPPVGGLYVGADAIRAAHAAGRPGVLDITTTDLSTAGDTLVDMGTFTFVPADGSPAAAGEYVSILHDSGDGLKIERLVIFAPRMMPPQQ